MPITVKLSGQPYTFVDKDLMRNIGLLARELIIRRTAKGLDENGVPFKAYSASYREQKAAATGKASPVNLQVSGDMLNALTIVEVTDKTVSLGFTR